MTATAHHSLYPSFFSSSRVSSHGFDLHAQLNSLGLGIDPINKPIQNPLLSSCSLFGSSTNNTYPTMASLLASSLQQQQKFKEEAAGTTANFRVPYEEEEVTRNNNKNGEVKVEQGPKKLDWNTMNGSNFQNQIIDQQVTSQTDPSLYWNHATSFGGGGANWLDPSLNGPSAHSLI
jgi:hypothetical protein